MTNTKIRITVEGQTYRYHLTNTGHSSARFGLCRVCNGHASEVWFQVEEKRYEPDEEELAYIKANNLTADFWTTYECEECLVGHRECLESQRREVINVS